jgi:Mg2+-importing ATPase
MSEREQVALLAGLGSAEAARRLAEEGPNDPSPKRRRSLGVALRHLASPLVVILVLACIASLVAGQVVDASVVLAILVTSSAIEAVQTRRAHAAADALRRSVAMTATVVRDGTPREVPRPEVVRGDVVKLSAGDLVPADVELERAKDLHVNEASLTGESLPIERHAREVVHLGCAVVSGTGIGVVVATGTRTRFGAIATSLEAPPPATSLDRDVAAFGMLILKVVLFLVLFVFAVMAIGKRDPISSLLFAVALAVGVTPEFLPMIMTITLAKGAARMAKERCIVKSLAAIHELGSMDVLCCDKTGTLTTGDMSLDRYVDPRGGASERPLLLAYVNSYFESGVDNAVDAALRAHGKLDALDSAVLRHEHPDIQGFTKIDEIPFDFERRRVTVVAARDDGRLLVTKGAAEHVLDVCTSVEVAGEVRLLDDEARARAEETAHALGVTGYRVLAVAWRPADERPAYGIADEHDLVLAGFLAFLDPPREDATRTVAALRERGVDVKMITGDAEPVARHVAARVGLDTTRVLTGAEIERQTDPALAHLAEEVSVFARVAPAQKSRLISVLRARGHVVGFLGDGINDAPSLHVADVGISVSSAVDVAREAADVILLAPGLGVLLAGIVEGRRAFGNVLKYLLMGTSSNFGNMFSMAGAAVVLPFLPMLPTQILLTNFLYDLAQVSIPSDDVDPELTRMPRRWDMKLVRRFMFVLGPISSLYDFLTFAVLLRVLRADEKTFHTGWFVESLVTQTLVIFVIRTVRVPWKSRPSRALVGTVLGVVALAVLLPSSPLGPSLGFVHLPLVYWGFLVTATFTYLALVEFVKRRLLAGTFDALRAPS